MTAAGAVLIALILGPMAWLALRGDRVSGCIAPRELDPTQHTPDLRRPDAAARLATPTLTRIPMPDSAFAAGPAATGHRRRRPQIDAFTLHHVHRAVALPLGSVRRIM